MSRWLDPEMGGGYYSTLGVFSVVTPGPSHFPLLKPRPSIACLP